MPNDPLRSLRLRWDELLGPGPHTGRIRSPELDSSPAPVTPRFIGRVRDAGAIPTLGERVFLVNPVKIDGAEAEGAGASLTADESRSIPVVVIGSLAPKAGDVLVAYASGGRWVSEFGARPTTVVCGGCKLPRRDLTLTWTNNLLGTHSAPMVFNGIDEWATGCINQISFRLSCRSGAATFTATYFVAGHCPTGQPVVCSSPGSSPIGLTASAQSCDPLFLQYTATSCPALSAQGYTKFTVTQ
ncbi:MAG: hypothetical protein BGO49_17405 [Planctomycetales bacterium 71-10]|nr:MAG: hypothetical protein BGO49_17405 [Planctomycetales bacterium 71-10]